MRIVESPKLFCPPGTCFLEQTHSLPARAATLPAEENSTALSTPGSASISVLFKVVAAGPAGSVDRGIPMGKYICVLMLCGGTIATIATSACTQGIPPVYITQWGSCGSGPGQFNNPRGIGIAPDGHVFVAD